MPSWTQAILWLSVGLYGYLIVHHALQTVLSKERGMNLWLIGLLACCLVFSFVDVQMYQPTPGPPRYAYAYAIGQFTASGFCATLFVQILSHFLRLPTRRWVQALWAITLPLPLLAALGWIVAPAFEARPIILGGLLHSGRQHRTGACLLSCVPKRVSGRFYRGISAVASTRAPR
jgi:hypothetical protein